MNHKKNKILKDLQRDHNKVFSNTNQAKTLSIHQLDFFKINKLIQQQNL